MKWEAFRTTKEGRPKLKCAMLRWKVTDSHDKSIRLWPPTPDPSPQPSPAVPHWDSDSETVMSTEDTIASRPKSVTSNRSGAYAVAKPLLADVLANKSAPPYTLSAFTAFLSQNHCLETLEFVLAARKYQQKYIAVALSLAGMPMTDDAPEVKELQSDWKKILDVYLSPGSFREINLPAEERDDLIHYPYAVEAPPPEMFEPAIKRMHDLMQESIWMPFLNQYATVVPTISSYNASSPNPNDGLWPEPSRNTADSRKPSFGGAARKRHSPSLSGEIAQTHPHSISTHRPLSSALTSALHKTKSGDAKLAHQVSNASVGSSSRENPPTDESESGSPALSETNDLMTPPTTPPSSDVGLGIHHGGHSPKSRIESGAWKRMGQRLGWNKKKTADKDHLPPPEEEEASRSW